MKGRCRHQKKNTAKKEIKELAWTCKSHKEAENANGGQDRTPSGRLLTVPLVPPGCVQEALAVMHQELVLRVLGCPQEQGQQVPAVNHPTGRSTGTQGGAAGRWAWP